MNEISKLMSGFPLQNGMRMGFLTITPLIAEQLLLESGTKRPVSPPLVSRYANDMMSGYWRTSHQGIAFDCEGGLHDGQHRLSAVVKSNEPIRFMVCQYLIPVPSEVIDRGRVRSISDVLQISGLAITRDAVHVITTMVVFHARRGVQGIKPSAAQVREYYEKHRDAVDFALSCLKAHEAGIRIAVVQAAIAKASLHEDRSLLLEFGRVLITGECRILPRDNTAVRLREWLKDRRHSGHSGATSLEKYRRTLHSIYWFCRGIRKKSGLIDEEIYPASTEEPL